MKNIFISAIVYFSFLSFSSCKQRIEGNFASTVQTAEYNNELDAYEAIRILDLEPVRDFHDFIPEEGIRVTKRDEVGNPIEAFIRVLSDNPKNEIYVIGDFNKWQKMDQYKLSPLPNNPHIFEGQVSDLKHGNRYMLLVNGQKLIDPASTAFSNWKSAPGKIKLESVFWDFDRPGGYHPSNETVDLREKPVLIGESEVYEMSKNWKGGPKNINDTFRFIMESGLIDELKNQGYNAMEFVPFNASLDADWWSARYQVFGLFAPDPRYGTPDDFAKMIDRFNQAGIAVIMDAVVGHYPFQGGEAFKIEDFGLQHWKKENGQNLFGQRMSPWNTYRYDYANPYLRRLLIDSLLHMMGRYGITGVRFDNYDGIRFEPGGTEFLKQLAAEVREYRPEAILIAEMFFGDNKVMKRVVCEEDAKEKICRRDRYGNIVIADGSGYGINFRTNSDFFDFIKDNMLNQTEYINMDTLVGAIRNPWNWGEAPRVQYITNHDEAANGRNGATGEYVASLIIGEGYKDYESSPIVDQEKWKFAMLKTKAFASLAMLSSSAYLDMPQLRLLQRGSFSSNPGVDWGQREARSEQDRIYKYFADLSHIFIENNAFAFINFHQNIENHFDSTNKIISLYRFDQATNDQIYAIVSLQHKAVYESPYEIGVHNDGEYEIILDSDSKEYLGDSAQHFATGALDDKVRSHSLRADCSRGMHGKPCTLSIPYIGEYATIILKQRK